MQLTEKEQYYFRMYLKEYLDRGKVDLKQAERLATVDILCERQKKSS